MRVCLERYTFFDRSAAKQKFELLAFLTDWLPEWLTDAVPKELIAAVEILVLLMCITALCMGIRRILKRCGCTFFQLEFRRTWLEQFALLHGMSISGVVPICLPTQTHSSCCT